MVVQTSEKISFEKWFLNKFPSMDQNDLDYININKKFYNVFYKRFLKEVHPAECWLYLTLSPDKYKRNLDNNAANRELLNNWAVKWFGSSSYYGDYKWVIEAGSKGNHLHLHAVCQMKSSKNHAERLKKSWARTFPKHQLLTTKNLCVKSKSRGEYAYATIKNRQIMHDKYEYISGNKSDELLGDHSELHPVGLEGSRGALI